MAYPYNNNPYNNYMINPYQQYQQPVFQQPIQQQTQNVIQNQQPTIPGRIVSKSEDIAINEISMDGNFSFFPNSNGTEIYGKKWNADGTVTTILYKADTPKSETVKNEKNIDEVISRIESKITDLSGKIDDVKELVTVKTRRKEAQND